MNKIRPLYDQVLVKAMDTTAQEQITAGGIVIPPSAQEAAQKSLTGTVLAVGTGRVTPEGKVLPMTVQVGDSIYFGKYAGSEIEDNTWIIKEHDVLGVTEQ